MNVKRFVTAESFFNKGKSNNKFIWNFVHLLERAPNIHTLNDIDFVSIQVTYSNEMIFHNQTTATTNELTYKKTQMIAWFMSACPNSWAFW